MGTEISILFNNERVLTTANRQVLQHTLLTEVYKDDCVITARVNRTIKESDVRRWLLLYKEDIISVSVRPCDDVPTEDLENDYGFTNAEEFVYREMGRYRNI